MLKISKFSKGSTAIFSFGNEMIGDFISAIYQRKKSWMERALKAFISHYTQIIF